MFSGLRAEPRPVVHRTMFPDSSHEPVATDEIRRFAAQVAQNPESLAFARLADAYRKAGAPERALETVEEGLLRHPDYLSAHIVRARTLREMDRRSAASAAFRRVLELDPQNLVALRALAELAVEAGDGDEARRLGERLQELEPLDEQMRSALRAFEPPGGEDERVERVAEERPSTGEEPEMATESRETGAEAHEAAETDSDRLDTATMAELYLRQGLYEEAERVYARLLRFRPDDPEVRRKLERVRILIGGERPEDGNGEADAEAGDASEASRETRPELPGRGHTIRQYLQRLLGGETPHDEALDVPRPSAFDAWLERRGEGG